MTINKFRQLQTAANTYCEIAYIGSRIQIKEYEKMVINWAKRNCHEKCKNSKYFIHVCTGNLGTKKYPFLYDKVEYEPIAAYKETDCYLMPIKPGYNKVRKDSIIGYLS